MLAGELIDSSTPLIDLGDRVALNRIDEDGIWWVASSVEGWGAPASTSEAQARYGADGVWQTQGFRSSREVNVSGTVLATSQASAVLAADRLKAAVSLNDFRFTVDEHGLQRYLTVRRSGEIDIAQTATRFAYSFSVSAGDPMKYSVDERNVTSKMLSVTGGIVVPSGGLVVPSGGLSIPATVIADEALITNEGSVETYPRIVIVGPIANPIITNETTGKQMTLNLSVTAGNYLEIDVFRKTVKLNGTTDRLSSMRGDWLTLPAGDNIMRYQGAMYEAASEMTIYWRDRWE